MPATIYIDNTTPGRGVSKLSRALSKLSLRSPSETDPHDIHFLRIEQTKLLKSSHSNARSIISHTPIPSGLTKSRVRDYVHSISITSKGKAFIPQYTEIIPGHLFLADHFTGTNTATLSRLRITHVISITHTPNQDSPMSSTIEYHELVVPSNAYQARRLVAMIDNAVDFIDDALRQVGCRVLVHCRMGVQWAPALVIAWFMRNGPCDYEEAQEAVRRKREVIDPGFDLERGVKEWLALELARPLFPPGRGGRSHPSVSSLSPDPESEPQDEGEVLDIS